MDKEVTMDGPIISFDVSKNSSHMKGFIDVSKPISKAIKINHDLDGFNSIKELARKIEERTNLKPAVVYEFTGVYALPLLNFFIEEGYKIYQISPLESAKMRKAEIRPVKNDSLDTNTIAKVYYTKELKEFSKQEKAYEDLKEMSRHYQFLIYQSNVEKNRYHRCLDAIWPMFDEVIEYDSEIALAIVKKYKHPSNVKTMKGVLSTISECNTGRSGTKEKTAMKIFDYVQTHNSGVNKESYMVDELISLVDRINNTSLALEKLLNQMKQICLQLPEFEIIKSIPSVGDKLSIRLLAEIGNISKYSSSKSLIAYAGLDPMIMQSGKQSGEHMHITKKGNSFLRSSLYLLITCLCRYNPDSKIALYVSKKKNDGLHPKAAKIAGCNKLLRIIYSMLSNGTLYSEKQQ